jgi:RNA polymerase sigma-B factor
MPRTLNHPAELTDQETAGIFERFSRERAPEDREALVIRHLPLARYLARKFAAGNERDDLDQVASIGLLKAIDRFDPDRGLAFASFAVPTILGELKRYFRDHGWSVRVPRSLQELATRVDAAAAALTDELGRSPTADEVATRCDVSVEQVLEARATATAHRADSLDRPVGEDHDESVLGLLASEERGYERVEHALDLEQRLRVLPDREREILRLRFAGDLRQREIAALTGLSQMHVSRLIRSALETLHADSERPSVERQLTVGSRTARVSTARSRGEPEGSPQ